ncbi:hypothetical protein, partial [Staphylococcus aureus]|uniref:hypothetical protein n=1 Tax=Staphylococcus aureus TaxID=1280 RepID=UPI001F422EB3
CYRITIHEKRVNCKESLAYSISYDLFVTNTISLPGWVVLGMWEDLDIGCPLYAEITRDVKTVLQAMEVS